jgi:hypothetical protein
MARDVAIELWLFISSKFFPGAATKHQYLTFPLPLPSRDSFGFLVTEAAGNILIHSLACRFSDLRKTSLADSTCFTH